MKVINPATGETIGEVSAVGGATVGALFERARAAQPEWAGWPLHERCDLIRRFRAHLQYRVADLARILTSEVGKPITQSRAELERLLPRIDYFLAQVESTVDDEVVYLDDATGMEEVVSHEPLGVIANVSSWNYPYYVGAGVFVPGLLTGNAVLYKPSELAPLTGQAIAEMLWGSGVPEDVFGLLQGGADVGAALIEQPVDAVFFTGTSETGRRIARSLAGSLIRLHLELGGNDPVYVCDDVDVRAAAESLADGAFYNNGQSGSSVERIYVHERIHDEFVAWLTKTVEGYVLGDPNDEATYFGPVARASHLSLLDAQVADAVALGATVRTGGRRLTDRPGNWFAPTVLTDTTGAMAVMREESFGPLIGIERVSGDEQALALMNEGGSGLTGGVYSTDEPRATDLLRRLDVGTAYWNCCDRVSPRLPWSGRHQSGAGSTLSRYGILSFVQPKAWHLRQPG